MKKNILGVPEFSKLLTSVTLTLMSRILLYCMPLGRDWLSTQSAVARATFMNEYAPYGMQAQDALVKGLQNMIIACITIFEV